MSLRPWLTVVTVVKDDASGFERSVRSLAAQELAGVEFIVIDSSGDQGAIPALLGSTGVRARVEWTAPAGIYAAMNTGLARASGEYVYFLNAGDELAAAGVVADLRAFVTEHEPTWLYGDVEIVGADGSAVVTPPWDYAVEQASAFSRGHFPPHQGTLVRTEVLRSIGGFNTSFRIVADYAAFLRLTQVASPTRFEGVLARFHEGGVSTTHWAESLREFRRARRSILQPVGALALRERIASVRQFSAMAAYRSPWPLTGTLALLVVLLLGLTGVAWGTAVLLTLFVAAQGLGGAIWWRLLRPTRSVPVLEAVGMGLGLGTAAAMLTGLIGAWWLAPIVAVGVWQVMVRGRHKPVAVLAPLPLPDLLAVAAGLVPGLVAFAAALRSYPLSWTGLWTGYHGDMAFFEALAASVARLGPKASIFMAGADIRYHSLAYGWAGQLTLATDAAPFVVLTRLLPLVTLVATVALAAAWARRLTAQRWVPALAAVLVISGGFVGATFGSVLNFDSPSQSMGVVWILALSPLLLQALDRVSLPWHLLAVAGLVVALTGGKVSTAAIAAAGFACVVLAGFVRREPWRWRALLVGGVGLVALVSTYVLLLAGSANSGGLRLLTLLDRASSVQSLNPVVTPKGIVAGIAIMAVATLPRWAGLAWLTASGASRWLPSTTYGLGLAGAGIATIVLLSGGFNDLWFSVAASAPLAILSAVGAGGAWAALGPDRGRSAILAAVAGLASSLVVAWLWTTGSTGVLGEGWRWLGPPLGLALGIAAGLAFAGPGNGRSRRAAALSVIALVAMALPSRLVYAIAEPLARPHEGSLSTTLFSPQSALLPMLDKETAGWTQSQAEAGAWMRTHAASRDVVATNLTAGALVPALTRVTTYLSDIHMQAPYGPAAAFPLIQQREEESWAFINRPSASSVAPLCRAGVSWIWVDHSRTTQQAWSPYADVAWQGPGTTILRLAPSACR